MHSSATQSLSVVTLLRKRGGESGGCARVADDGNKYRARDKVRNSTMKPVTPRPPLHSSNTLRSSPRTARADSAVPRERSPACNSPHGSVLCVRFSLRAAQRCVAWSPTRAQGGGSIDVHATLRIRLSPAARCRLMRRVRRATRRPTYSPAHCACLPPLLLCCVRRDLGLNGQTLPTSSSCSLASYKSKQHLKLLADTSSSLLHAQIEPVDGQRAAALECMWRGAASGVPHGEWDPYACEQIAFDCQWCVC